MNKSIIIKYYQNYKKIVIKILFLLFLLFITVALFFFTKAIISKNTKMLKYINSGISFEKHYLNMKKNNLFFSKYIIKVNDKTKLEKTKSDYINLVLNEIKNNNLENVSYQSDIIEKDGFIFFKYNITVIGDFVDLINFFSKLKQKDKSIYVKKYEIRINGDKWVRVSMEIEVLGEKNY